MPDAGLAVAITVNQLSAKGAVTNRLLGLVLEHVKAVEAANPAVARGVAAPLRHPCGRNRG